MRSPVSGHCKDLALFFRFEKVLEESIDLVIRLRRWAVAFPVGHGYAVRVSQELVDSDCMIEGFPTLRRIFCAT